MLICLRFSAGSLRNVINSLRKNVILSQLHIESNKVNDIFILRIMIMKEELNLKSETSTFLTIALQNP